MDCSGSNCQQLDEDNKKQCLWGVMSGKTGTPVFCMLISQQIKLLWQPIVLSGIAVIEKAKINNM
jgi:hypothetical protein